MQKRKQKCSISKYNLNIHHILCTTDKSSGFLTVLEKPEEVQTVEYIIFSACRHAAGDGDDVRVQAGGAESNLQLELFSVSLSLLCVTCVTAKC